MNKNPPFGWIAFVKLWSLQTFIFTLAFDCTKHLLINLFHTFLISYQPLTQWVLIVIPVILYAFPKFGVERTKIYSCITLPHTLFYFLGFLFFGTLTMLSIYIFFSIDEFWRGGKRSVELYVPGQGCYDHLVYH